MKKIKILVVEANKIVYEKIINNGVSDIYGLVYYPYEKIRMLKNVFLIYSKEATETKNKIFKPNIKVNDIYIYGTLVIVGKKRNSLISLTEKQIEKIKNMIN